MALQAPEGTKDLLPDEAAFWARFKATAANVCGRYGYAPIETPLFEQTELFVRGIGEATDVVSKEMFTAISGQNLATLLGGGTVKAKSRLSLRPEGTAGVVRACTRARCFAPSARRRVASASSTRWASSAWALRSRAWTPRASSCSCASSRPSAFPRKPRVFW